MHIKYSTLILVFVILCCQSKLQAQYTDKQQIQLDSLNKIIKESKENYLVAKAYNDLSEILYISNIDTIIYLCNKSKVIAEENLSKKLSAKNKKNYLDVLSNSYNNLGFAYMHLDDYALSLQNYNRGLSLSRGLNDKIGETYILNNLGLLYIEMGKDSLALDSFKNGIKTSESINNVDIKAMLINNIGTIHESRGDYDKALNAYEKCIDVFQSIDNQVGLSSIYNNIGAIYGVKGDTQKALDYYLKSLKIKEEVNNLIDIPTTLGNIADLNLAQGNIDKAFRFYERALKIAKKNNDKDGIASVLHKIGSVYLDKKQENKAIEYYEQALQIAENIGNKKLTSIILNDIGILYETQDKLNEALQHYEKCLKIDQQIGYTSGIANALNNIGNIYFKKNQLLKAKKYSEESLNISQGTGELALIRDASWVLASIYKKQNNWKNAYSMNEQFLKMRDRIHNKENEKSIFQKTAQYELDKKQFEITNLEDQNKIHELRNSKNRLAVFLFSLMSILLIMISLFSYKNYKKSKEVNLLLVKQYEEKKAMLKEIHHRVKNNLQVVNSLLRFQSNEIEDKNVVSIFKEAQQRVVSMALLHEKMYNSEDLTHINVQDHITLLVEDLVKNYKVGKDIDLDVDIEEVNMGIKKLVPLGLIINEIISNALKYAFENTKKGTIKIHLKKDNLKGYEMTIGDNGIGMSSSEMHKGLGAKLIEIFTKQLNGVITKIDTQGTQYRLTFPNV